MRSGNNTHIHLILLLSILGFSFSFTRSKKDTGARLVLSISHLVGSLPLKLDSVSYKNNHGQNFTVTKFKYYLSHLTLREENGKAFEADTYFLVNEEEEITKQLLLENIPFGNYTSLEFTIGVDSLHNCSGAQSGALDPVNGMFWAWNSGYIFLKLEGFSPASKLPGHIYEYHIGGYREPNNCIRKVSLPLEKLSLSKNSSRQKLFMEANVMELLTNPVALNFEQLASVNDFHNATLIADNYKDMFRIVTPQHEN